MLLPTNELLYSWPPSDTTGVYLSAPSCMHHRSVLFSHPLHFPPLLCSLVCKYFYVVTVFTCLHYTRFQLILFYLIPCMFTYNLVVPGEELSGHVTSLNVLLYIFSHHLLASLGNFVLLSVNSFSLTQTLLGLVWDVCFVILLTPGAPASSVRGSKVGVSGVALTCDHLGNLALGCRCLLLCLFILIPLCKWIMF